MLFCSVSHVWCSRDPAQCLLVPPAETEVTSMSVRLSLGTFGGRWVKPLGLYILLPLCRGQRDAEVCYCLPCRQIGLPTDTPVVESNLGSLTRTLLPQLLKGWFICWVWVMKLGLPFDLCCWQVRVPRVLCILSRAGINSVFPLSLPPVDETSSSSKMSQIWGSPLCWTSVFQVL